MKTYMSIFSFLLMQGITFCQKNVIEITYEKKITIGQLISEEDQIEAQDTTSEEVSNFFSGLEKLVKTMAEKNSVPVTYITDGTSIQYIRSTNRISKDEVIMIDPQQRITKHYFTNKDGKVGYNEFPICLGCKDKEFRYSIETYPNDKKKILGYDCFRVTITTIEEFLGEQEIWKIDAYVTTKIDLPLDILAALEFPVFGFCPLEFSESTVNDKIEAKEEYKATQIQLLRSKTLKLPKRFRKATKFTKNLGEQFSEQLKERIEKNN